MLTRLARGLGLMRGVERPHWTRRLSERGVDPLVVATLRAHRSMDRAWWRCPRVDWALEVAVRARVEPALVVAGLSEVLREAAAWRGADRGADPGLEPLEDRARRWARREVPDDELLAEAGPILCELVDGAPGLEAVLRELREAERWKQRARIHAMSDAYDEAHLEAHRQLADRLRSSVSSEALAFALEGSRAHPYR